MTPQERYDLIEETMRAFHPFYRDAIQTVFAKYEIEGRDWFYAYLAAGLEPEPLSAALLGQMTPYANPQSQAEWLQETAAKGLLQAVGENSYCLTAAGRAPVAAFFNAAHQAIAPLAPLPAENMARMADLLAQIIAVSEVARKPARKTHLLISRRTDPGPEAVPAVRIDQYLTDLVRYREDARLAAWVERDVDGRTWNAFRAVGREDDVSAAGLAETHARRQFSADDYAVSLSKLVEMGWIAGADGAYQLTAKGQKIQQEAEEQINQLYFSSWLSLRNGETAELDQLLLELRNRLRNMAADQATATFARAGALAGEISGAFFQLTRPVMDPLMEELGLAERGLGFALIQAGYFDPDPISDRQVRRRFPYAAPGLWDKRLRQLAAHGLLTDDNNGDFQLTAAGQQTLTRLLETFRADLATIEVAVDLEQLAELLGRVTSACLDAPEPPGSWAIRHSRRIAPPDEAPALAKIDQYLDDLNAFRDDAHLASFAAYDISGHGWELFSQIWRGEVSTAAEMAEKMAYRGYDEAAYTAALADLVARGWITVNDGGNAVLTAAGSDVRERAEKQTDRYFFRPWLVLNQAESETLWQLMASAQEKLAQLTQPEPSPA